MGKLRRAAPLVAAAAVTALAAATLTRSRRSRPGGRPHPTPLATGTGTTGADSPRTPTAPDPRPPAAPPHARDTPAHTAGPATPRQTGTLDTPGTADPATPPQTGTLHTPGAADPLPTAPGTGTTPHSAGKPATSAAHTPGSADPVPAAPGTRGTAAPPRAPRGLDRADGRRAVVGVLVALVAVAVLGGGALVVAGSGGEGSPAATSDAGGGPAPTAPRATSTTVAPPRSTEAFALAASHLEAAGSFAYRGTASATDVSAVRPSLWVAVDTTVDGQVELATGRLHEVAVAPSGQATETVADGTDVWGRRAATAEALAGRGYERIPSLSTAEPATKGITNLPRWLAGAVDPVDAGVDEQGRRRYQATIPATLLGPTERGRRAVDASVVLVLDRRNQPVHVEIATVPGGPPLSLALDLSSLGAPAGIAPPA